jgi:hypothetical protein
LFWPTVQRVGYGLKVLISRYLARVIRVQEALHGSYVKVCIAGQGLGCVSPLGNMLLRAS